MPQQPVASVQNHFIKGLVTEYTGLDFPEDAATECDNTTFTIVGEVTRRLGIDEEENGGLFNLATGAKSSYIWKNVGGDGETQLEVIQTGAILSFFSITNATASSPLSKQVLTSTVNLSQYTANGGVFDSTLECQYADGNGYLFVYQSTIDPVFCSYSNGVITSGSIQVSIRDFTGVAEPNVAVNLRPQTLTAEHLYNLTNQGWVAGNAWSLPSVSPFVVGLGPKTFSVQSGVTAVTLGQQVRVYYAGNPFPGLGNTYLMIGTVTAYSGGGITINVTTAVDDTAGFVLADWIISPSSVGYIDTWHDALQNYPSNSDVWWYFKNSSEVFDPATTFQNITSSSGNAPKGHYLLAAFQQERASNSGAAVTNITTTVRPRTGTWFQGRVWYTGVDGSQPAMGDANYYTWTENIYFSQVIQTPTDFGACYQYNDPTSENLVDLLPTDGGVINMQGLGSIYKLFPYQNGLLVFAANGIKFITGSQGIGFTANDYTITDISSVRCVSGTSFVNVNGIPYFWNEEGIYSVQPSKNGGLTVDPITVSTILTFYNTIPLSSKKYARGSYDPINYTVQWLYKTTESTGVVDRYSFDGILNYLTYNQAFFPYTVDNSVSSINTIDYIAGPGGLDTPEPTFKYLCTTIGYNSFADEHDETYTDWASFIPKDYSSYFITGFQIRGQAQKTTFPGYVWMFSNSGTTTNTAYNFNSIWDYASNSDSGRWSRSTYAEIPPVNYGVFYKRHKVRGHGMALQFQVQSVSGINFDIIGWSSSDNVNTGI